MGSDPCSKIFYGYKVNIAGGCLLDNSYHYKLENNLIGRDKGKQVCFIGAWGDNHGDFYLGIRESLQSIDWNDNPYELNIDYINTNNPFIKWRQLLYEAWNSLILKDKPVFDENNCKWLVICDYF